MDPTSRAGRQSGMGALGIGLGVILAIGLAVLLGIALTGGFSGDSKESAGPGASTPVTTPEPTGPAEPTTSAPSPTAKPAAGKANCDWQTVADNPNAKDVGIPATSVPATGTATMRMTTNLGQIEVTMDRTKAPCTIASFAHLAGKKFFDGSGCHRLVTTGIFVLQCGDPSGTGSGGPLYRYADENLPVGQATPYDRGVVAMANGGPNTNGSQFFFCFKASELPPDYTVLGTVTKGMNVIDAVAAAGHDGAYEATAGGGHPKKPLTFTSVTVS